VQVNAWLTVIYVYVHGLADCVRRKPNISTCSRTCSVQSASLVSAALWRC